MKFLLILQGKKQNDFIFSIYLSYPESGFFLENFGQISV